MPATKRRKKKKSLSDANARIACAVCGAWQQRLTAAHVRKHGLSLEEYRRAFSHLGEAVGAPATSNRPATEPTNQQHTVQPRTRISPEDALARLGEKLLTDRAFVARLGEEVSEAIFAGPVKSDLRSILTHLLHTRMAMHGRAVGLLEAARKELSQPWRITAGGPNGLPTDTSDLVAVASAALAEVRTGEDLLLKTVKLAIDEGKSMREAGVTASGLDRYAGAEERIPVPPSLGSSEREAVRNLLELLGRSASRRTAAEIEATVLPAGSGTPAGAEAVADPAGAFSAEPPRAPTTGDDSGLPAPPTAAVEDF